MSDELILTVCSANVCRSPLAAFLLTQRVSANGIRVESAGMRPQVDASVCSFVADFQAGPDWGDLARTHRSRQLTQELLAEAALVLTATRDIRGEVVRLLPDVRDRVFTLREAVYLGSELVSPRRHHGRVSTYAAQLDQARPMTVLPHPERRLWGGGQKVDPLNIVDRHGRRTGVHRAVIAEVDQVTAVIAQRLNE